MIQQHHAILKMVLYTITVFLPLSVPAQLFMRPYVESTSKNAKNENVEVVSVEKQKRKTIVIMRINNLAGREGIYFYLRGIDDSRAHKIVDVNTKKEYLQKCTFGGDAQCTGSKYISVPIGNIYTLKLIFQPLEDNVTDIDIITDGQPYWSFNGIKLLDEQAMVTWKARKEQEETEKQAAISAKKEAEQAKKEQEKLAYEKRLEDERRQKADQAAKHEKEVAKTAEELTKQQTYSTPEFDGVYAIAGKSYVQLIKANVLLGSIGRMVGSYSDFNLFRNYFLPYDPPYVYVSKMKPRLILVGDAVREISSYRVSDVIDVKNKLALVARDVNADKMYYDSPIYIPHVLDNFGYKINQIQRKTISSTKAEIQITETLDPAQSYVLWNIKTGAYFFFKVK